MLITKRALMVNDFAAKEGAARYGLDNVHVTTDGRTVATDGHRLAVYTPKGGFGDADFPTVDGVTLDGTALAAPINIPADAAKAIERVLPKKAFPPVLGCAAIDCAATNANGHVVVLTTDLETPNVRRIVKNDHPFPEWEKVVPGERDDEIRFRIDLRYLEDACKMLRRMGFVDAVIAAAPGDTPVVMNAGNDDGECKALIVPMGIKN